MSTHMSEINFLALFVLGSAYSNTKYVIDLMIYSTYYIVTKISRSTIRSPQRYILMRLALRVNWAKF